MKKLLLAFFLTGMVLSLPKAGFVGEAMEVSLAKGKITARTGTVDHGALLNICSKDEAFHQPYSVTPPNKFGSSKAKEKDMLSKGQCRLVEVKNTGKQVIEMTLYDRFMPSAYLVLKVNPKPIVAGTTGGSKETSADAATYPAPMQGNQRLAFCYAPADGCGEKAADSWCQVKGYKGAKEWEIEPRDVGKPKATRYVGSDLTCKRGQCDAFTYITCRTGPPTFF